LFLLFSPGGEQINQNVGTWTSLRGLVVPQSRVFERRKSLTGVTLINVVLPWAPISLVHVGENGTITSTGLFMELVDNLKQVSVRFCILIAV
jgi:hypothetical protein